MVEDGNKEIFSCAECAVEGLFCFLLVDEVVVGKRGSGVSWRCGTVAAMGNDRSLRAKDGTGKERSSDPEWFVCRILSIKLR